MKSTISEYIPLSIPMLNGNEWTYVKQCLDTNWVSSVGSFVEDFEKAVATFTGAKYAVATVNGTAALHICLKLMGVQREDYVIIPNVTFVATANAVHYTGASPILMDINEATWQMDLDLLEAFLMEKTFDCDGVCTLKSDGKPVKAIMPVHVLGNMCDMNRLCTLAEKYGLQVVEDSTESLGSWLNGKHSGTFGKMGCFSFNGNKIITTGGGGMIVTDDDQLAIQAKHLTTTAKTDPIEYFHDEIGYNYRLVNILAAMGVAQMEQLPDFLEKRKSIALTYQRALAEIEHIRFPQTITGLQPNHWLTTIQSPQKDVIFKYLNEKKIQSRPLWTPMNQLPMYAEALFVHKRNVSKLITPAMFKFA